MESDRLGRGYRGRLWPGARRAAVVVAMASLLVVAAVGCGNDSGERADTVPLPEATLWAARSGCEKAARVDATGQIVARVDAGCELRAVAVGAGGVWFSSDTGAVIRVDPASNEVVAPSRLVHAPARLLLVPTTSG